MPNQIAISCKLDSFVYEALEAEMRVTGVKRNRLINKAIWLYITNLDEERRKKSMVVGT